MDPTLSLDLILEILDCLAVPLHFHQRSSDRFSLVACSLVCKAWSSCAQRLLFRRVVLRQTDRGGTIRDSFMSFLPAIDPTTERGQWLIDSIVSLTLGHTSQRQTLKSRQLAFLLLKMPNLRELNVSTSRISCNSFDSETITYLRDFGPRIVALAVFGDQRTHLTQQLVAAFPSIRILEIDHSTRQAISYLRPFGAPLNLSLVSFKIYTMIVDDIGPCLDWLVGPSPDTNAPLQLFMHLPLSSAQLGDVLEAHGAHLRFLLVSCFEAEVTSIALACPKLERLHLTQFPSAKTLALIPRSITVLALRCGPYERVGFRQFLAALETFPNLKMLIWSEYRYTDLPVDLKRVCSQRGIELRMPSTHSSMDSIIDGYYNAIEVELRKKYIRI
ncbi:hypothetical protein B0H13DRAFT_2386035 [Mycena leptocephala]|nr:hypothetical protein B0H13DRAFT_2386035 [Mycena leptocephala]